MRILVFNGSPKCERSDTMVLTNAFLKGFDEKKGHDIKILDVIKLNIAPCLGCFQCWKDEEGRCVQDDDEAMVLEEYEKADLIIFSFPLYSYGMPSSLKALVDRMIPFNKMTMKEEGGRILHLPRVDLSEKKLLFIIGSGFPTFEYNFQSIKIMIRNKFGPRAILLCISETPMLNEKDAEPLTKPLIAKFVDAGRYYDAHFDIPKDMKDALETPMLDKETYIKIVNSLR